MKIVFISPEVYPYAKTGGLGDVSYSLPDALVKKGHDVIVIMPRYYLVNKKKFDLQLIFPNLSIPFAFEKKLAAVYLSSNITSFKTYFIEYDGFFGRNGLYGDIYGDFQDNPERFAFFCGAVFELLKKIDFYPDIIHCNDWQTGLAPVFLKNFYYNDPFFEKTATVITVHNAGYQGIFDKNSVFLSWLSKYNCTITDIESDGKVNYLKAGIMFSDIITTVSRKYASEIQTEEFGYALADIFRSRNKHLFGILNGIDNEQWDPSRDLYLLERYSHKNLNGKRLCKQELQKRMGLPINENIPVIGIISRLTYQKGLDILADTMEYLLQDEEFQFMVAGSGDDWIYKKFERIKVMFPEKIGLFYGYDEELAHIIHAGLDIFVMPSRYEPCGLSVMYSLRYGTVPVVRATGGLDDFIIEWDAGKKRGNGFKFDSLTVEELYKTIRKVIRNYRDSKDWNIIQKNAMEFCRTWDDAVIEYERIYNIALNYQKY